MNEVSRVGTRCGGKREARGGKILFRESAIFKIFAWINFRESTISEFSCGLIFANEARFAKINPREN